MRHKGPPITDIGIFSDFLTPPFLQVDTFLTKSRGPILHVTTSETCSVCVKQALNTRCWLVNVLVTWHVSYKITTLLLVGNFWSIFDPSELGSNTFLWVSPIRRYCTSIPRNDDSIDWYVFPRFFLNQAFWHPDITVLFISLWKRGFLSSFLS